MEIKLAYFYEEILFIYFLKLNILKLQKLSPSTCMSWTL